MGELSKKIVGGTYRIRVASLNSLFSQPPYAQGDESVIAAASTSGPFELGLSRKCVVTLFGIPGYYYNDTGLSDYMEKGFSDSYGNYIKIDNSDVAMSYWYNDENGYFESFAVQLLVEKTPEGYRCTNLKDQSVLFTGWNKVCVNLGSSSVSRGLRSISIIDLLG